MLCLQVTTPFPEAYRETLHAYKISEQDTDVRANVRAACSQSVPCYCPHPHVPCFLQAETHTLSHPTNATFYALAASYLSWREISPLLALLLALVEHGSVWMGVCSTPHPISGSHPSLSLFLAGNRSCWGSSVSRTKCCGSRRGWCNSSEQRRFVVCMVLRGAAATSSAPGLSACGDKPHCKAMGMARKQHVLLSWGSSVGWGSCAHVMVPCIHGPLRREKATPAPGCSQLQHLLFPSGESGECPDGDAPGAGDVWEPARLP